tara:strand:- start:872 stop:1798 length:927 start_codon:yes stop_codon:yes gene_type:complete
MINKKLTLILLLILIIFLLIYYLNNYNFYNNILLLKFVDYNNNNKIISKYPINNYPNKYKIKIYNIKENIIPIPSTYIENFLSCYGKKGLNGNEGAQGLPGIKYNDGQEGEEGSTGPTAVYKSCNGCSNGENGKNGENGNLVKSVTKTNNTLNIKYENGTELVTGNIKGVKGDKKSLQPHHKGPQGPQGPQGSTQKVLNRNHKTMYLPYINIQTTSRVDPWIYTLANNCFIIAAINENNHRPAMFYRWDGAYKKLGFPWLKMTSSNDGGDYSRIIMIGKRDDGSIKFKLKNNDYGTMTVISFWFSPHL